MNTNQQWNQGQMPTGGNPQMQPEKDSGRKGLIIAISIVSVLVLALGGFIAYKMLIEKKSDTEVASEASADSLKKTAAVENADTLSKALAEGKDAYGKGGEMTGLPDAVVLGFEEGVKDVEFGFEAGYGYTYHFNLNGQLASVDYFDYGTELKLFILNGRAQECSGQDNGFGDELIEQEQLYNGEQVDKLHVYLTLRGDTDLDGKITALDAQFANLYFLETVVLGKTAEDLLEDPDSAYLNRLGEMRAELFQFSHYACDTHDGNGEISALDSQDIRMYFLENTVLDSGTEWNEIANSDVVPFDDLHAAPLGRDEYVGHTDGWQLTEAPAEEGQG